MLIDYKNIYIRSLRTSNALLMPCLLPSDAHWNLAYEKNTIYLF
jgi:hypothetical protein